MGCERSGNQELLKALIYFFFFVFLQKFATVESFRAAGPALRITGRVAVSSEETVRMPRAASGMPDERNANTDAERGQIQYNHNKSKQIHSHRQSDCGVHCQNANQPKESGLLHPNENRITDLDQAD